VSGTDRRRVAEREEPISGSSYVQPGPISPCFSIRFCKQSVQLRPAASISIHETLWDKMRDELLVTPNHAFYLVRKKLTFIILHFSNHKLPRFHLISLLTDQVIMLIPNALPTIASVSWTGGNLIKQFELLAGSRRAKPPFYQHGEARVFICILSNY
jgi:hypothetical protein